MIKKFIRYVASNYGITLDVLQSKTRLPHVVEARRVIYACIRKYTNMTYSQIGEIFNQDHSSIVFSVQKYNIYREIYPDFKEKTDLFERYFSKNFNHKHDFETKKIICQVSDTYDLTKKELTKILLNYD